MRILAKLVGMWKGYSEAPSRLWSISGWHLGGVTPHKTIIVWVSVEVEFGANDDLDLLVERAGATEAELVDIPVHADDRLLRHYFFVEEFHAPRHSHWQVVFVLN